MPPLARRTDPDTSKTAAARADTLASRHAAAILAALEFSRFATATELAQQTGLTQIQTCRRLPEIARAGLCRPTGNTKDSPTGRPERIWTIHTERPAAAPPVLAPANIRPETAVFDPPTGINVGQMALDLN